MKCAWCNGQICAPGPSRYCRECRAGREQARLRASERVKLAASAFNVTTANCPMCGVKPGERHSYTAAELKGRGYPLEDLIS